MRVSGTEVAPDLRRDRSGPARTPRNGGLVLDRAVPGPALNLGGGPAVATERPPRRRPRGAIAPARPADVEGDVRYSASVAELTGLFNLSRWSAGMRVIAEARTYGGARVLELP